MMVKYSKEKDEINLFNLIDIDYKIIIDTGESGINANVMLCIYGDKDISKNIPLRLTKNDIEAKFDQNSRLEFHLKEIDIGKVNYFLIIL